MRAAFLSFLGYFLTPTGLLIIGFLDASIVFFLPLGIDFVSILMTARRPALFWLYTLLATVGSTAGSAGTYWMGAAIGEKGLTRFVRERQLARVRARFDRGAALVGALGIVPPPFPFTPFVLAAGALEMAAGPFFAAVVVARLVRFGVETALAAHYGAGIVRWTRTPLFEAVVGAFIALVVIGTIVSAVVMWRSSKSR